MTSSHTYLGTEAGCNSVTDMLRSSCCDVLCGLSGLWVWIQDLSGCSYYVLNHAFHKLFSDIPSIHQYYLTCSCRNTAVLHGEGMGGFAGWEKWMSFHVRGFCLPLMMWLNGLHQNLMLHLHSQWRLFICPRCVPSRSQKALKGSIANTV